MNIAEQVLGDFRIYAAAVESAGGGGFRAGVVVRSLRHPAEGRHVRHVVEAFRDECLEDGKLWACAQTALAFALEVGRAAIQAQLVLQEFLCAPPGRAFPFGTAVLKRPDPL